MGSKRGIIPTPFLLLLHESSLKALIASIDSIRVSSFAYKILIFYVVISTALSFFPFYNDNFVLHPFDFLIHFVSYNYQQSAALTNFLVIFIIYVVCLLLEFLCLYKFFRSSKFPPWAGYLFIIIFAFVYPLITIFSADQIGNIIFLFVQGGFNVGNFIEMIVLMAIICLNLYTFYLVTYNYAPFVDGFTFCFTSSMALKFYSWICILRILSKPASISTDLTRLILSIISLVVLVLFVAYCLYMNLFIMKERTSIILSVFYASFIYQIYELSTTIENGLVFIIFFLGSILGIYVNNLIMSVIVRKSIEKMDLIQEDNTLIEELYPNYGTKFLCDIRNAFSMGHYYVLSGQIFQLAEDVEIKSTEFFIHFMKVMAIYKVKVPDLASSYFGIRDFEAESVIMYFFNIGIKHLIDLRSPIETNECKKKIEATRVAIKELRTYLIKYWRSVQQGTSDNIYQYADVCRKSQAKVDGYFETLMRNWPNCEKIYKFYVLYLNKIVCDYEKVDTVIAQYKNVKNSRGNVPDSIELRAKSMFPTFPLDINSDFNSGLYSANESQQVLKKPDKQSTASSLSLGSSGSSLSASLNTEEKEEHSNTLNLRYVCEHTPMRTNLYLIAFSCFTLILVFVVGVVLTYVMVIQGYNTYNMTIEFMTSFTSLTIYVPKCAYNILSDGLENIDAYISKETEYNILGIQETLLPNYYFLLPDVLEVSSLIDNYIVVIPKALELTSGLTSIRKNSKVNFGMFSDGVSPVQCEYVNISYAAAVNQITEYFMRYSTEDYDNGLDFSKQQWFLSSIHNSKPTTDVIMQFSERIASDVMDYIDVINDYTIVFPTIATILACLALFVGVIFIIVETVQFSNISKALSKIPPVIIIEECRKLMSHLSNSRDDKTKNNADKKEKEKASNLGRDFKSLEGKIRVMGGYPIVFLISFYALFIAILIATSWVFGVFLRQDEPTFRCLPLLNQYFSIFVSRVYNQLILFKRTIAAHKGKTFGVDTIDELTEQFRTNLMEIVQYSSYITLGEEDGLSFGILFNNFQATTDFLSQSMSDTFLGVHDALLSYPPLQSIEIILNEFSYFSHHINEQTVFTDDNFRAVSIIHFCLDHILNDFISTSNSLRDTLDETIQSQQVNAAAFLACILVVDFIFLIIFYVSQYIVKENTRYVITTLALLNPTYIQTNEAISTLLSGDFSVKHNALVIDSKFIEGIEENVDSAVFRINESYEIKNMNKHAQDIFVEKKIQYLNDYVDIPKDEVTKIFQSPKLATYKCTIEMQAEDEATHKQYTYPLSISFTKPNAQFQGAIVIMTRNKDIEKAKFLIDRKHEEIDNIMKRIIPHDMRDSFKENSYNMWVQDVVLVSVKLLTFSPTEETVQQTLQTMTEFNRANYDAVKECRDCSVAKKFSTIIFSIINMKEHQMKKKAEMIEDALKYLRSVYKNCSEKELTICAAVTYVENMAIGRLSRLTTNFNLYSPEMHTNYSLVRTGKEPAIRFDRKCSKLLPEQYNNKLTTEDFEYMDPFYTLKFADL